MPPPSVDIRDIYGWRFGYNIAADSTDAVKAATNTFMDNAATITVSADDPAAYALAVQTADPRGYNEKEHFYKRVRPQPPSTPSPCPRPRLHTPSCAIRSSEGYEGTCPLRR